MKAGAASTAKGVALVRALEMQRPPDARLSEDPLAIRFVHPLSVAGLGIWSAIGMARATGVAPMMNFALLRERAIMERMAQEARAGLAQLVILGAGFDTRAYRLPELAGVTVFEVDHPVTQAQKRAALAGLVTLPETHRFVAVDFDVDDLGTRLAEAGYRPDRRTLFVWQGVIMYLTREGIDATLRVVARAAPDSVLVFDYFEDVALTGGESAMVRWFADRMGERLRFTLDTPDVAPFLTARGFTNITTEDGAALAARYGTDRPVSTGVAIATARVKGPPPA